MQKKNDWLINFLIDLYCQSLKSQSTNREIATCQFSYHVMHCSIVEEMNLIRKPDCGMSNIVLLPRNNVQAYELSLNAKTLSTSSVITYKRVVCWFIIIKNHSPQAVPSVSELRWTSSWLFISAVRNSNIYYRTTQNHNLLPQMVDIITNSFNTITPLSKRES